MQKTLNSLFNGEDPASLDSGVVFKRVMDNIQYLPKKEVTRALSLVGPVSRLKIMKKRCEQGDDIACIEYDICLNGDPSASPGGPKNLGIRGQCHTGNRVSCETLEELGEK